MRSCSRAPSRPPATGSLASSEASITPAWQATTTSWPGWPAASASRAPATRLHEPGPALAAGGDGLAGVDVPVERAEPGGELAPRRAVGLPGVELAQSALGHQRGGGRPAPSASPATRAGASSSAVSMARGSTLA